MMGFFKTHRILTISVGLVFVLLVVGSLVKRISDHKLDVRATPSTATPVALSTREARYLASTQLSALDALTLNLPQPWQIVTLDATQVKTTLAKVPANAPTLLPAVETLQTAVDEHSVLLTARWLDPSVTTAVEAPGLLVAVLPRNQLSLAQYLAGVSAALRAQAGVSVQENQLDYTLLPDGVPAAILHYTLPATATGRQRDGYQVVRFDKAALHLVLFNFSVPTARYTELLPNFQAVVRTAHVD